MLCKSCSWAQSGCPGAIWKNTGSNAMSTDILAMQICQSKCQDATWKKPQGLASVCCRTPCHQTCRQKRVHRITRGPTLLARLQCSSALPRLRPGCSLARHESIPERAPVVDNNGAAVTGQDGLQDVSCSWGTMCAGTVHDHNVRIAHPLLHECSHLDQ